MLRALLVPWEDNKASKPPTAVTADDAGRASARLGRGLGLVVVSVVIMHVGVVVRRRGRGGRLTVCPRIRRGAVRWGISSALTADGVGGTTSSVRSRGILSDLVRPARLRRAGDPPASRGNGL